MDDIRVGTGYDVHAFAEGRPLVLGGVTIPHERGLQGHSDADVLSHAIGDAMLGAAGLGDIGTHFPDTDARYRGISSLVLLQRIIDALGESGYTVTNVDATVVAERPKLSPFVPRMRDRIGEALGLPEDRVSIKATTSERLGFTGREEGIAALAVVLIRSADGG
ncbi:MAG: 2-C-methyl-D-erythritol 2,4-cyclodiphosphate synthase [Gemmatimonadetes bacterium]|nr:2-C-methyl-D-erythritol 2,4-cyclodiphosphate synthase [Gemmatimonadota bacterium]MYG85871.1 2-C-methyl-D-erythritol 2,4-cyclodiphosphate synthase [Gemmatimonadota bacterium]MYJ89713.1 2-C-methyl-D-erythritol 2,4-cyclodiphosphate synthase [Gemmatimonadota bacterium]